MEKEVISSPPVRMPQEGEKGDLESVLEPDGRGGGSRRACWGATYIATKRNEGKNKSSKVDWKKKLIGTRCGGIKT